MRIIAGEQKGRRLQAPKGQATRPTLDKIRGAVFDCLYDVADCRVLDPFGGSGAIVIEAVSRGAAAAIVGDSDKNACKAIAENIAQCRYEDRITLKNCDYRSLLTSCEQEFDLIFLDPPYGKALVAEAAAIIRARALLKSSGMLVAETGGSFPETEPLPGFRLVKQKRYGDTIILYYRLNNEVY